MRVLVTGAAGRIGRVLCGHLHGRHEVRSLDLRPGCEHTGDLLDEPLLRRALSGVDAVLHLAALHAPQVGVEPEAEFERINVQGTALLARLAAEAGVRHFVFTSTTALYGGAPARGPALWIDEDTPPGPRTVYHRSKRAAESLLQAWGRRGLAVTVLRMARCFPEPAPLMALYRLHRGIDARDVAEAHAQALVQPQPGWRCFIVAAPPPFTRDDAAELGTDAPAVLRRRAPALVQAFAQRGWPLPARIDRVYDPSRAERLLGWRARHGFETVLDAVPADERPCAPSPTIDHPCSV